MKRTFKSFLLSNAAPEPLNIGNYLAICDASGRRPFYRIEFVAAEPAAR